MFLTMIALCGSLVSCKKSESNTEVKKDSNHEVSMTISSFELANDLAQYGYEVESASALIEAADILTSITLKKLEAEKDGEFVAEITKSENSYKVEDLLASARKFAYDDSTLLSMIGKVESRLSSDKARTRGSGIFYEEGRVNGGSFVTYSVSCSGGLWTEVSVVGDGDTDLDLYVYDYNGNLVSYDEDYGDRCYCAFIPSKTSVFIIKIVNRGNVYNRYQMVIG